MWRRDARRRLESACVFLEGRNCAAYPTLQREARFASEWLGLRHDFTSRGVVKDIRKAPAARNCGGHRTLSARGGGAQALNPIVSFHHHGRNDNGAGQSDERRTGN
jgi:hypothetical protein